MRKKLFHTMRLSYECKAKQRIILRKMYGSVKAQALRNCAETSLTTYGHCTRA
jgi:hypothetical protein